MFTTQMRPVRRLLAASAVATLVVATIAPALAQAPPANAVRVRGTIVSLDGSVLDVKSRDGSDVKVMLKDGWKVGTVTKASLAEIKAGDFVGVAAAPKADGSSGALEVLVFPAGMAGTGEGHYPWDLQPNSTMTNATVTNAVTAVDGRNLTLSYSGGNEKAVSVPENTPVVTFGPAEKSDLVAGATVFIPAQKQADNSLEAAFVVVGKNGVVPPM